MKQGTYIAKLVKKYVEGKATDEEIQFLHQYYDLFEELPEVTQVLDNEQIKKIEEIGIDNLHQRIQTIASSTSSQTIWLNWALKIAAVLLLVGGIMEMYRYHTTSTRLPEEIVATGKKVDYNRFISLPDGTTVILHGNSELHYSETFNKTHREVTLEGEAFFDVTHNLDMPFIITTGTIKTTVLGTAFNIKAWPDQTQIVVSVERGKVKVEREQKLLAYIEQKQEVRYNLQTNNSEIHQLDTDTTANWTQTDMSFDNMAFKELLTILEKRYNIQISFQNPQIAECLFTGRFTGKEDLEEILKTLSLASGTTYKINGNQILIIGDQCN